MECDRCGKGISEEDAFCRACGAATGNRPEAGAQPGALVPPAQAPQPPAPGVKPRTSGAG
jgi:predicted amidophosphoribosyltransferase